jgi:hypothetical protein
MNRAIVKALHKDVDAALAEVAKKHGFEYKPSNCRFSDVDVTGRMCFVLAGKADDRQNQMAEALGLSFRVGDKVLCGAKEFTVVGFKRSGSVLIQNANGKTFRAYAHQLRKPGEAGKPAAPAPLDDASVVRIVRRVFPRLSAPAARRMVHNWRFVSLGQFVNTKPFPTNTLEVVERAKECIADAAKPIPGIPNTGGDGEGVLNEAAEAEAEARMS